MAEEKQKQDDTMVTKDTKDTTITTEKSNPYELYLVCKSNISIRQGDNPDQPLNKNSDFFVGDIFQAKVSREHSDYIQLRAASQANKKQWINIKEKNENVSIMNTFPPSINEYFHLNIGDTSSTKCKYLNSLLLKSIDQIYAISFLKELCGVIITYLPFNYPVFTANGTLFRGRGHFTQFSVPYFHTKSHCKEYLRRIEQLRTDTIDKLNQKIMDADTEKLLEYEYEKKLMLDYKRKMQFEFENDPDQISDRQNMSQDQKEEEMEDLQNAQMLDAEYLNKIVSVQKGSLPNWITSVYESIPSPNAYYYCIELYFMNNNCMVPFKKDEYLEQNKYLDFIITNETEKEKEMSNNKNLNTKRTWDEPKLMAYKIGKSLQDMIDVNEVGGSRWFDIEFNPNQALHEDECAILDANVEVFRCKIGGKWQGDSRSRHYIDVKNKNGDIFSKYLPMIVINLVL